MNGQCLACKNDSILEAWMRDERGEIFGICADCGKKIREAAQLAETIDMLTTDNRLLREQADLMASSFEKLVAFADELNEVLRGSNADV